MRQDDACSYFEKSALKKEYENKIHVFLQLHGSCFFIDCLPER